MCINILAHVVALFCMILLMFLDIDECSLMTDNCSDVAHCTNIEAGFNCTCYHGYEGDGVECYGTYRVIFLDFYHSSKTF